MTGGKREIETMNALGDQDQIDDPPRQRAASARTAFTLLELLTVIGIIAVLVSLLFPAVAAVKESGRKALAGAEVHRIAAAVRDFQTEYGKLPVVPQVPSAKEGIDVAVGDSCIGMKIPNRELFYTLRSIDRGINSGFAVNYRMVVYFEGKNVADQEHPRDGFLSEGSSDSANVDCYFDPWGIQYCIVFDYSYDEKLKVAYGDETPRGNAGAFSLGPDRSLGASGSGKLKNSDDLASWK
jgi:prepilin-type N-terminal cleavage/methylation domain-containing protein